MTHVQKFAALRKLWTLLPLVDNAYLILYTLKTTYSTKVNWETVAVLQNTHIGLFKSPRDVHQVTTLSVQLGLGSVFVDWHRDSSSVPFGYLFLDLSPRTDNRLRYCTKSGFIPSTFYVPDNLKHLKHLDDEHSKLLYPPSIQPLFPRMQSSVSENLSKRIYPISQ